MKLSILNDYEIMINYFNKLRWERFGYTNYRTFANKIGYKLNTKNEYEIRKTFYILVKQNFIEKTKQKGKYLYKYNNPYYERFERIIVLDFS